jgi:hypothetical protein
MLALEGFIIREQCDLITDRVMVFLDYQNVYHGARDCFHPEADAPYVAGQISPARLAEHLVTSSPLRP